MLGVPSIGPAALRHVGGNSGGVGIEVRKDGISELTKPQTPGSSTKPRAGRLGFRFAPLRGLLLELAVERAPDAAIHLVPAVPHDVAPVIVARGGGLGHRQREADRQEGSRVSCHNHCSATSLHLLSLVFRMVKGDLLGEQLLSLAALQPSARTRTDGISGSPHFMGGIALSFLRRRSCVAINSASPERS